MHLKRGVVCCVVCVLSVFGWALAEEVTRFVCPSGEYAVDLTQEIRMGDSGDTVLSVQQRLRCLGFLYGETPGVYDNATADAVLQFRQSIANASAIGKTDSNLDVTLLDALYSVQDGCVRQDLRIGDSGSEVMRLQRRLCDLGYLSRVVDSTFGAQTRTAVRAFQNANGLKEDGIATVETQKALYSLGTRRAAYPATAFGDRGPTVVLLQENLMRLGFMEASEADGHYGKKTEAAVMTAQEYLQGKNVLLGVRVKGASAQAFGLPTEDQGIAVTDSALSPAAGKSLRVTGEHFVYTEEDPYLINVNGVADSLLSEFLATQDGCTFLGQPKKGDTSPEIGRIQRRLYSLEYLYTKADAVYGPNTERAITAFQERNDLAQTGQCDAATLRCLFSPDCKRFLHTYQIVVDVSDQRVYVYSRDENDEYTVLEKKMKCSTGKTTTPTPIGTFKNTGRGARWHYFKKFDTWAQYAYYIEGDILFHSVLFNSDDESTLIRSTQRNLGNRASHGCVRLAVDDAKWIWNNCDAHTTVIVQN